MARQVNLKINNLHIRYEDDYFSHGNPYTLGWVVNSFEIKQSTPGAELWTFSDFLEPRFTKVSAKTDSPGNGNEEVKDEQIVFKDITAIGCKFYKQN